jgi:AcrR family transcriptional regulator
VTRPATTGVARLELRGPRRARRSHAERTAETRARIVDAVVDSVATVGFQRATATEIAARAGVTWGAVQHQFGDKDAMLVAVLEESFRRFAERIEGVSRSDRPLAERVARFVERAWEHFNSRYYRAAFEILLNYLGREDVYGGVWRGQMAGAWDGVWRRIFWDTRLPRARDGMLQRYTISVLSGLASTAMLQGSARAAPSRELALLTDTLVRELGGDGACPRTDGRGGARRARRPPNPSPGR